MRKLLACGVLACVASTCWQGPAWSSESDQFMLWGVEIEDGADALNAYLNREFDTFLEKINEKPKNLKLSPEEMTEAWYKHIFRFLLYGKIRGYLRNSGEVKAHPPRSNELGMLKYQKMSIFRSNLSFPYILPMARTVRMGDIYLGTDKISHMLGYGRRYFVRYQRWRRRGYSDYEAKEKVIRWGLRQEGSVVGRVVDGVVSYGDLEANYQGLIFGLAMCCSEDPLIAVRDGKWVKTRDVDLVKFMTPDMDESYNTAHFWLLRKRFVIGVLKDEYVPRMHEQVVRDRFAMYDTYPKSLNMQLIELWLARGGRNPKELQSLESLEALVAKEDRVRRIKAKRNGAGLAD